MLVDAIRMACMYIDQLTPRETAAWIGGVLLGLIGVKVWVWLNSYDPDPLSFKENNNHARKR